MDVFNSEMSKKYSLGGKFIKWAIETTNSPHGIELLPWYGRYFLRPIYTNSQRIGCDKLS